MLNAFQDQTPTHRHWLMAIALWLAVTTVSGIALWHMHTNALNSQLRETGLIALALNDEVNRGLNNMQVGVSALREQLHTGGFQSLAGGAGDGQALNKCAKLMPWVKMLWLVGPDGRVLSASDTTALPEAQSFSPRLEQLAGDMAAISQPFTDPTTREAMIALAVRASGSAEGAAGWIVAGFPASALFGTFSVIAPGTDARMAIFRNDGVRLVGMIDDALPIDDTDLARILANQPSIGMREFSDGSKRLLGLQSMPQYGLKLVLTRDLRAALEPWREIALSALTGIALLLAVLVFSVRRVVSADQRYAEAQRALQAQRSRTTKFESLGTLASGVAHDFNNVLAAILGYGEMAHDAAPPGSSQARHLDKVLQAALRGKALIERILTFSRTGAHNVSVFELEPIVEEVLSLLETSLRNGVSLKREFNTPTARLRGDPIQAFEAVMNLCTNAMQAMPDGGVLGVRLERVSVKSPRLLSHGQLTEGAYLAVTVSDQGVGIGPETMEHLFEPFFTTHGERSGTGLGLAVVHGVVGEFGGAIDVRSVPAQGSQFTLYFPECSAPLTAQEPMRKPEGLGMGQRLMVIDDEPALVMLAEEILGGLGYEAVGFSDPVAALAALREDPQQFSAVITDEVMPQLCGTKLTEALREIAPELPVLLISGCGGALLASRAVAVGVTRVLSKPLQRTELERALADILPFDASANQDEPRLRNATA